MNMRHFLAFVLLRWRLFVNRLKRGGIANVILLGVAAVGAALLALALAAFGFTAGVFLLQGVAPAVLMYVWDGAVMAFVFIWNCNAPSRCRCRSSFTCPFRWEALFS